MGFAVVNVSCEVSASEGKEQIHGRGGRGGTVEVALETLPLGLGPHPVWGRRPPSLLSALPSVLGVNSWVTGSCAFPTCRTGRTGGPGSASCQHFPLARWALELWGWVASPRELGRPVPEDGRRGIQPYVLCGRPQHAHRWRLSSPILWWSFCFHHGAL